MCKPLCNLFCHLFYYCNRLICQLARCKNLKNILAMIGTYYIQEHTLKFGNFLDRDVTQQIMCSTIENSNLLGNRH